ncbi:hypothetical protein [uncultured Senegalimassilia sp.]|nr:hypothetical protein [uncultured Senegalimassilia sp.]
MFVLISNTNMPRAYTVAMMSKNCGCSKGSPPNHTTHTPRMP